MYDANNPLSAISYTNKDFQTIYPELLETVKKLTQKWDPTISNESDPGVILIKLNAIIADKNNYNIDKNVLENYPETYTQELSARSQYKQLGYKMPWYRAATTRVRFKWNKTDRELKDGEYITIPRYTMVTDSDNDKIFTTINDLTIGKINNGDGTGYVDTMQGVLTTLSIAGTENITLNHLDSKNRIYINDYNIAQNGIFITNTSDMHNNLWTQVDNVEVQATGTPCYEFDVDPRSNVCYLQFPDYVRDLIGSGITIKYLITRGYEGNVSAKVLTSVYEDVKSEIKMFGETVEPVTLNNESLLLYNSSAATDGRDPETIDQAYKSYKHVVGTFDTLVTLRDYMNAIYNSELVSNVVVTDRSNDIQSSYKVLNKDPDAVTPYKLQLVEDGSTVQYVKILSKDSIPEDVTHIYKRSSTGSMSRVDKNQYVSTGDFYLFSNSVVPYMSAFDLKYYLLKSGGPVSNLDEYDTTFEVDVEPSSIQLVQTFIDESKSLQHDIKDLEYLEPFMLQNVYPIKLKIVPTYKLSDLEMNEVKTNIQSSLRSMLHSRNVDFGAEPQYDIIYDTISNCDNRIKVVMMDDFEYTTFALYRDEDDGNTGKPTIKKVPINNFNSSNMIVMRDEKSETDVKNWFYAQVKKLQDRGEKPSDYFFIDLPRGTVSIYNAAKKELEKYSDRIHNIRQQVFAKNVLAGVTPLYSPHNKFKVGIDMQQQIDLCGTTDKINTSLEVAPFGYNKDGEPVEYNERVRDAEYKLGPNENLRFLAPSITTDRNYSSYVKYELVMKAPTGELNYVYANPEDEAELLRKYGINNFYRKDGTDRYTKVTSSNYTKLSREVAKFRLDSYFYSNNVSGSDVSVDALLAYQPEGVIKEVTSNTEFRTFVPTFEPYMYYHKLDGEFYVLTNQPVDWPGSSTYYKLKQFVPTYVDVAILADTDLNSDTNYIEYKDDSTGVEYLVSKYDESVTYYRKDNYAAYLIKEAPENDTQWAKTVVDNKLCVQKNLIHIDPTNEQCYEVIPGEFSNYYTLENGHYRMVYQKPENGGKYYMLTGDPDNWDIVIDLTYDSNIWVKYVSNGSLDFQKISLAVPPFELNKFYMCTESRGYTHYSILSARPSDWSINYTNYFKRDDKPTEGLSLNSVEYDQWKKGILTLYVAEGTYKINADTDYQLREGDYLTFFWREEDADDAPYQYIRYDHIYDKENNLPTIIRPNFTLNGSSYSNCIINPQKDLNSSGVKNYDAATNSDFQKIYTQLVKDYDLSGTKSIDLRKINSKPLDNKNYIYFITKSVDTEYDAYMLYLTPYSWVEEDGNLKVSYRYTLQDDEHFVYTNEQKDAFEVLSAGTLLQLTRTYSSYNIKDFEPVLFYVDRVNISDVMYYGIDTFKDQCIGVELNDNWLLIEQQIYSFTSGDTINLRLEDSFCQSYNRCTSKNIEDYTGSDLYLLTPNYVPVKPVYDVQSGNYIKCVPQFTYGKYYNSNYELLLERPNDWPANWPTEWVDGQVDWIEKYWELDGSNYEPVNIKNLDKTEFAKNYTNYYVLEKPSYPVYNDTPTYIRNYSVQYKSGGSAFTNLPKINVLDDQYQWCVTAHLNINMDQNQAQIIKSDTEKDSNDNLVYRKSKQSISIPGQETADEKPNFESQMYVLADINLDKVGGSNVDISYITSDSTEPVSVEIFTYTLNEVFKKEPFGYTADGNARLSVARNLRNIEYTIDNICLDTTVSNNDTGYNFSYLLPILVNSDDISYELYANNVKLSTVNNKKTKCSKGINYFKIDNNTTKIKLVVSNQNTEDYKDGIIFQPLYKYTERDIFDDEPGLSFDVILSKIQAMDIQDCFKYDHVVDESISIENPLSANSMFDNRHVYNQFTIAKAELRLHKANGSTVTFVNNK